MDVVICVSSKDCLIVKKTIFYIRRNIESDNIYLITDRRSFGFFSKRFRSKYNVSLIDEEEIVADRWQLEAIAGRHFTCVDRFGWYYQQFLKMEFARSSYAKDYYLIWDSDTIPLNRLSFLTPSKMIFTPKTEYHEPYFRTIQAFFGYGKAVDYSFIAEHMLISVPIMKELIRKIETSGIPGDSWFEKVINATPADEPNGFSEFETYGTYCHYNYPDYFILKELRTFREAGSIYSRSISKRKLRKLSKKYDTISLESWNTPRKFIRRFCNDMEECIVYPLMKQLSRLR